MKKNPIYLSNCLPKDELKEVQKRHRYLEDLGIELEDTPYGWNPTDARQDRWQNERNIYGFDERETWSLDSTFFYWLYERLMKYNEVNNVDTLFYNFNVNGKIMTQQECIDRMLKLSRNFVTRGSFTIEEQIKIQEETEEVFDILKVCLCGMWW